jgi:hypothetical protein
MTAGSSNRGPKPLGAIKKFYIQSVYAQMYEHGTPPARI